MMRKLELSEVQAVDGGFLAVLGAIADAIVVGTAIYQVGSYFAQDNGGPSAADWSASVGYVG